ncbi:MAG: DnaJ domain-containing protein [Caulobacter sp.]|nr:DnaJ domain-containing protein [Caulobacter sp.]
MTARTPTDLTPQAARALLGVAPGADERELRAAYREAAKRAHPDRPGGDAALFRDVLAAYRLLQDLPARTIHFPPVVAEPARVDQATLRIDATMAFGGGTLDLAVDGRKLRLTLPAGLREHDKVRVEGVLFRVALDTDPDALVRGDDLWLTARLDARSRAEGGRIEVATALGPRLVWISTKAAARGLVRLPGQGLPARGKHRQGDLFLRLETVGDGAESAARSLLKRFAAAWAA